VHSSCGKFQADSFERDLEKSAFTGTKILYRKLSTKLDSCRKFKWSQNTFSTWFTAITGSFGFSLGILAWLRLAKKQTTGLQQAWQITEALKIQRKYQF